MYYVIEVSEIDKCSVNNLVACWDVELDTPITEVCELSAPLFGGNDTVER